MKEGYHHGSLQEALLDAADALLTEGGVEGFTLREAARRAGVSPAAPAHHFGGAKGLLTEVAIRGFEELGRCLRSAGEWSGEADTGPREDNASSARFRAQGMAYVGFALAHPGRFQLMFRHKKLIAQDERLMAASRAAHGELEHAVRDYLGKPVDAPPDRATMVGMVGAWSLVHGFAQLALDGKFDRVAGTAGLDAFVADILPEMLKEFCPPPPAIG